MSELKFFCNGCQQEKEHSFMSLLIIRRWGEGIERFCLSCHKPQARVPDVFFNGKPEENLADGPDGKPRVFFSKGEKAQYLKDRGIMEAGDRVHGAPVETHKNGGLKIDSREAVREALHKVNQMGRDVRRQEYLKVIKEGQR